MKKLKVAVGLSGGVDSSVAAVLLKEQGYEVIGVHMRRVGTGSPECTADQDRADALRVAKRLDMPFRIVDFRDTYNKEIIHRFLIDFQNGLTPNPDIWCNEIMKFGLFLDYAVNELEADKIATGHYARIQETRNPKSQISKEEGGEVKDKCKVSTSRATLVEDPTLEPSSYYRLLQGVDTSKDQSYFLYRLTQSQLSRSMFPLGGMEKRQVRELAEQYTLPTARKKDSVGVCFIGDMNMRDYLKRHLSLKPGEVVTTKGEIIGTHEGVQLYTIGQRHGFTVEKYQGKPLYVVAKDIEGNRLIVGRDIESDVKEFLMRGVQWISKDSRSKAEKLDVTVRVRHLGKLIPCTIEHIDNEDQEMLSCTLRSPERGIASGQHAVLYSGGEVLGGGVIGVSSRSLSGDVLKPSRT